MASLVLIKALIIQRFRSRLDKRAKVKEIINAGIAFHRSLVEREMSCATELRTNMNPNTRVVIGPLAFIGFSRWFQIIPIKKIIINAIIRYKIRILVGKSLYCPPAALVLTQCKFKVTEIKIATLYMRERIERGINTFKVLIIEP